jgi:hypothetical protein
MGSTRAPYLAVVATFFGVLLAGLSPTGCDSKQASTSTYFDRTIAPILATGCVRTNTGAGCHVADEKGNAFGNLDLSSYEGISKRHDLLLDYGPYGQPALLAKNLLPFAMQIQLYDGTKIDVTSDIKHAGGAILDPTASGFDVLKQWIANGATANNSGTPPVNIPRNGCNPNYPSGYADFDPTTDPTTSDWATFQQSVNPALQQLGCSAGNCHGNAGNNLFLTCGDPSQPPQVRWNYYASVRYLGTTAESSEIVRRPLSATEGGAYHEGGPIFTSTNDAGYQTLLNWAGDAIAQGEPMLGTLAPEFQFFAARVEPLLAKKGCMMVQCHSAAMFHDYRLRGGSGASFSYSATKKNYDLTVSMMSFESDDVNASRLVRKNLYRPDLMSGSPGLLHRGGALLEDFPGQLASGQLCDSAADAGMYDYDNGSLDAIPAYCIIREWHRRERAARGYTNGALRSIVYVTRAIAPAPDRAQDFDVYAPGADLHVVGATYVSGGPVALGMDKSVTAGCGLTVATADIKRPAASWDGTLVAFAARSSADAPLQIYQMNADGSNCAPLDEINAGGPMGNGLLIHNFDPQYSMPDAGGQVHIVFASTRGNLATAPYDYTGPQRTPSDPSKPNANLYVDDGGGTIRQLTYHLDTERYPSFMSDGRVIFSVEKREPGFYELALRRINMLDGGDYHPLYSQRPTIGYEQAAGVVELSDRNFVVVFSDQGAVHGGGTLGIFNRSIGIDFTSANAGDYILDPSVIDPTSPTAPEAAFFLHSLSLPDPSASGHLGATNGLYTTPSIFPDDQILVSWGAATDVASFGGDYDVYLLDPATGNKTKLLGSTGTAEVEAVAVYDKVSRGVFTSRVDEPNGSVTVLPGHPEADINALDFQVLSTLFFQNTPTGRPIDPEVGSFDLYEELPPANGVVDYGSGGANVAKDNYGQVYVRRRLLGSVPLLPDESAHFQVPGGLPLLIHLPDTDISRKNGYPRWQRETISFAPGEYGHQSFTSGFFNNLCGQCHGSISGQQVDVAVNPDILTQASMVTSTSTPPKNLNIAPGARSTAIGPPSSP